jgi:hypothetical protein
MSQFFMVLRRQPHDVRVLRKKKKKKEEEKKGTSAQFNEPASSLTIRKLLQWQVIDWTGLHWTALDCTGLTQCDNNSS